MAQAKGSGKTLPIIVILSFVVVLSAYYFDKYHKNILRQRLDATLESLLEVERSIQINEDARIAVGYGSCLDIVTHSSNLITDSFNPPNEPTHHGIINSQDELIESFAFYYKFGAAAEYVFILTIDMFTYFFLSV